MLITSLLALAAATSAPTYLRCTFDASPGEVLVAADETHGSVTMTLPRTGFSGKLPAAFAVDRLTFDNRYIEIAIDRSTLAATRTELNGGARADGTCKVEDAPKRAF